MQTLLVGINYSDQSPLVLRYAFRVAQYLEAKLIVSYCLEYDIRKVNNISFPPGEDWRNVYEAFRLEEVQRLEAFVKEHQAKQFHTISTEIEV